MPEKAERGHAMEFNKSFIYLVTLSTLLFTGCIISGKVVDEFGTGIEGVKITLTGSASRTTITDSSGEYEFADYTSEWMQEGRYIVTPSKDGCSFDPESRQVQISIGSDGFPTSVTDVDFEAANCSDSDSNYARTSLLRGSWAFEYYHSDTRYRPSYSLGFDEGEDIIESETNPGQYYIFGVDEYGDPVIAGYAPVLEMWTLLDPHTDFDRFFVFDTDGSEILEDSCYYQVLPTGEWSACIPFNGTKFSSSYSLVFTENTDDAVDGEDTDVAAQNVPFDAFIADKYLESRILLDFQQSDKQD